MPYAIANKVLAKEKTSALIPYAVAGPFSISGAIKYTGPSFLILFLERLLSRSLLLVFHFCTKVNCKPR